MTVLGGLGQAEDSGVFMDPSLFEEES